MILNPRRRSYAKHLKAEIARLEVDVVKGPSYLGTFEYVKAINALTDARYALFQLESQRTLNTARFVLFMVVSFIIVSLIAVISLGTHR